MSVCPNCGARLSCGCQRKTATDGKQGCSECIPKYERQLSGNQAIPDKTNKEGSVKFGNPDKPDVVVTIN